MNKESLSYILGEVLELPRLNWSGESYRIISSIFTTITKALQEGQRVKIKGFGIFEIRERAPTRSPCYYFYGHKDKDLHWEVQDLPAKRYVIFKPSKVLLRMLNNVKP